MIDPFKKEAAQKWIKQSLHDKDMAIKNCSIGGFDVAAFLAHQSVEKLFKGLLLLDDKKIPRTHHIDQLARELNLPENLMPDVYQLAPDYQISRYPDIADTIPFEQYDDQILQIKLSSLERIFDFLKGRYLECIE